MPPGLKKTEIELGTALESVRVSLPAASDHVRTQPSRHAVTIRSPAAATAITAVTFTVYVVHPEVFRGTCRWLGTLSRSSSSSSRRESTRDC